MNLKEIFEDERCVYAIDKIYLAFGGLRKIANEKYKSITAKEVWAMKDVFYLDFDNYYGGAINWIGDTIVAWREACELNREEILRKAEHSIKQISNFN